MASHAGTTPMDRRRDAAAGVAELLLYVEQRAAQDGDSVGTVGVLNVPSGSINVVPGRCQFTLDLRAPNDAQRDALTSINDKIDEAKGKQAELREQLAETDDVAAKAAESRAQVAADAAKTASDADEARAKAAQRGT